MNINETVLLITGVVLFIFTLWITMTLIKKDKPLKNALWMILIAFFMMGFPSISNAEIFGLFKYEKEKKLTEMQLLADALTTCPSNDDIKTVLKGKIKDFEVSEKAKMADEIAVLGYAHYAVGNEIKAIDYSNKALIKDSTNEQALEVKKLSETQILIKELPKSNNSAELNKELQIKIRDLKSDPMISDQQLTKIQRDLNNQREILSRERIIDNQ